VLLDFTIAPVVFDAGAAPVQLNWCATVADNLSGIRSFGVTATRGTGPQSIASLGSTTIDGGPLQATICGGGLFPQFFPYGVWSLDVGVTDKAGVPGNYANPATGVSPRIDLCPLGPCQLENRPANNLPDADNDGISDDADNCPDDANADQADTDLDLIGDVCDLFPDDRDNEPAQCEADRADLEQQNAQLSADLTASEARAEDLEARFNQPPLVNAGPDLSAEPGAQVALQGLVEDDFVSLPVSVLWMVSSQPPGASPELFDPTNPATAARFLRHPTARRSA
jgi:hypothetical protein